MPMGNASSQRVRTMEILCRIPIVWSVVFTGSISDPQGPVTEEAFWGRLSETRSLVAGLGEDPAEACPVLSAKAKAWKAVQSVQLDNGDVVPIQPDWLVAGLEECPPDAAMLLGRMDALLAARGDRAGDAAPFSEDSLREILSREEFQAEAERAAREDPLREWITSVLEWLTDQAQQWSLPPEIRWAVGIAASVLLLGILLLAGRMFRKNWVANVDPGSAEALHPKQLTADTAAALARRKWTSGDKRLAVRYLYLSLLLHLEESGRFSGNRSLTDQEYLRGIEHLPALAVPFRKAAGVFERVWYGFHIPSESEYREYLDAVAEIRRVA
jgi:hypothetical protein